MAIFSKKPSGKNPTAASKPTVKSKMTAASPGLKKALGVDSLQSGKTYPFTKEAVARRDSAKAAPKTEVRVLKSKLTRSVKVVPKASSSTGSKFGIQKIGQTLKAQGEMKKQMAPPKSGTAAKPKIKPTPTQRAKAAGMVAAQRSRREGAAMNFMDKAVERGAQRTVNYLGQEFSDKGNRYNGLSNSQLSDKKKK